MTHPYFSSLPRHAPSPTGAGDGPRPPVAHDAAVAFLHRR